MVLYVLALGVMALAGLCDEEGALQKECDLDDFVTNCPLTEQHPLLAIGYPGAIVTIVFSVVIAFLVSDIVSFEM